MFSSVTVIGAAGQTGQLFTKEISKIIRVEMIVRENQITRVRNFFSETGDISSDIRASVRTGPGLIIVATPNPIDEILELIASESKKPVTVLLPQNGVAAGAAAEKILQVKKNLQINFVRASLFTTVSMDKEGKAVYRADKLRIALSPISGSMDRVRELFKKAGFEVAVFDDYKSMEWTKLIVNTLGSSAAITGSTTKETFTDEQLFELEMEALKDRLTIMKAAGIKFVSIPWQKIYLLPFLKNVPMPVLKRYRFFIAELIIKGRDNISPSALRKIAEGKTTELAYYHKPFVEVSRLHGLNSPVDEAMVELVNHAPKYSLLKTVQKIKEKPYFRRNLFKTLIVETISKIFSKNLSVSGEEYLKEARDNLLRGKSVILLANHMSHADHPALARAMRQSGFDDLAERLIFVAGMKFKDEFIAKVFNDAYARTLVATPTTSPQTDEEKRIAQTINLKGFFETNRILNKGNMLVIYPEGTRSRQKKLLRPISAVARYFENPNVGIIVPAGIEGTGDLLPAGAIPGRFKDTKVTFGKPIAPMILFEKALKDFSEGKKRIYKTDKKVREELNEKIMDLVMKEIASLLPAEQRGVYGIENAHFTY